MEQVLTNSLIEGAGSFAGGFAMGYGLKKVIRLLVIVVGAIAGIFFVMLALMQKQGYVSTVNWDKMSNDIYNSVNATLTNFHMSNIHQAVNYMGIPVTSGLGLGLVTGFLKG